MRTSVVVLLAVTALAASESRAQGVPAGPEDAGSGRPSGDPFEPVNRRLFSAHKAIDRVVLGPVARGYRAAAPGAVRAGVGNALANLGEPQTFINDVLQAAPRRAGSTAVRFAANTTVGVLGVFDVAGRVGLQRHAEDFGQTLGRYGVGSGPYLMVPVLGPSNLRDLSGRLVDAVANPLSWAGMDTAALNGLAAVGAVDQRARLDPRLREIEATALDEYATYRSLYGQRRAAEIANRDGEDVAGLPEFDEPVASTDPSWNGQGGETPPT